MAEVQPLRALRYEPEVVGSLADVVAPPYDVIDADQRARLAARSPYNVVRIDLPEGGDDPYATAAETLEEMHAEDQARIIGDMEEERAADILEHMSPDEAADVLGDLPEEKAEDLLELMEHEEKADVEELLPYEDDEAGGLMTTEFVVRYGRLVAAFGDRGEVFHIIKQLFKLLNRHDDGRLLAALIRDVLNLRFKLLQV